MDAVYLLALCHALQLNAVALQHLVDVLRRSQDEEIVPLFLLLLLVSSETAARQRKTVDKAVDIECICGGGALLGTL